MSLVLEFMLLGAFLAGLVGGFMILKRRFPDNTAYKAGLGLAVLAAFLLFWVNGAVGIIGSSNNDLNMLYIVVILIAFVGSVISRFRPKEMSLAMMVAAVALAVPGAIALFTGEGQAIHVIGATVFFGGMWAGSAILFRKASEFEGARNTQQ